MTAPLVIYLAGRYSRRDEFRAYARQLEAEGIGTVPARWLNEAHDWDGIDPAQASRLAIDDVQDLALADLVVCFTEEPGSVRRGGRHVEYGMALAAHTRWGSPRLVIVGPLENVFHALVPRYDTWQALLVGLRLERFQRAERVQGWGIAHG